MNRDEDSLDARSLPPAGDRDLPDPWAAPSSSRRGRRGRRMASPYPSYAPPTASSRKAPLKVAPVYLPGPSHPVWERPVSRQDFPKLRSRDEHRPMWPFVVAALLIAVVLTAIGILEAVGTHMGSVAALSNSPSSSPTRVIASDVASPSSSPSHSLAPTPATSVVCKKHYTVKSGDRWNRIAAANGVTPAELGAANPQVSNHDNLRVGQDLCIPYAAGETPPPAPTPAPSGVP